MASYERRSDETVSLYDTLDSHGSTYKVLPMRTLAPESILSSGWQDNASFGPSGPDEVQILVKAVTESGVQEYLEGAVREIQATYGPTNRSQQTFTLTKMILGADNKSDASVNLPNNGILPGPLPWGD